MTTDRGSRALSARVTLLRRVFAFIGIGLAVLGGVDLLTRGRVDNAIHGWAVDFDINWVAARRLVDGEPLYDHAAARAEGTRLIGTKMLRTGTGTFSRYIGAPPTALAHVPFLSLPHDTAVALFRLLTVLGMIGAVVLAAAALSPPARAPAAVLGVAVLMIGFPFTKTLVLGQGNQLVMLGLGLGIWAAARERWGLAGAGLGVATVLKISPGLLLVYLVVRGRRQVIAPAVGTGVAAIGLAAVMGRPGDLVTWVREVAPSVSHGTTSIYNQSLVGWIGRIVTPRTDLSANVASGTGYLLAYAFAGVALYALWRARRGSELDPLELAVLILIAVLAGPLSWDHYSTWAVVAFVFLVDVGRWARLTIRQGVVLVASLGLSLVLLHQAIQIPAPRAVASNWTLRLASGPYTIAVLIWLGVGLWFLARTPAPESGPPPRSVRGFRGAAERSMTGS